MMSYKVIKIMSSTYTYVKNVLLYDAFSEQLKQIPVIGPLFEGFNEDDNTTTLYFSSPLTEAQQQTLDQFVASYVDPPYYLMLDHAENLALHSEWITSDNPVFLQSFIMSPYHVDNTVMDQMKTVVSCRTSNVQDFLNWDPNEHPVQFTLTCRCYTTNQVLSQSTLNLNNEIQG